MRRETTHIETMYEVNVVVNSDGVTIETGGCLGKFTSAEEALDCLLDIENVIGIQNDS